MSEWVGIEELTLSKYRPSMSLPVVPVRILECVREYGPVDPVVVRRLDDYQYEILTNVETWLAVQRLGQHRILVDVRTDISNQEAAAIVKSAYQPGKNSPIIEARNLLAELDRFGGRAMRGGLQKLATLTGLDRSYISHSLRLLELPDEVQELVSDGSLPVGHAKLLVSIKGNLKKVELANRIINNKLSVRATEQLIRNPKEGSQLPTAEPTDPDIKILERSVGERLGCSVRIDVEQGQLVIDYARDLDVLDGVLERLGHGLE